MPLFSIINLVPADLLLFHVSSRHLIVDGGKRGGACTYSNMAVCGGRNLTAAFRPYDSFFFLPPSLTYDCGEVFISLNYESCVLKMPTEFYRT
jgi:hypothetical protein